MQRFFREPVHLLGVKAPRIREIAREAYRELKPWTPAQRNRFCNELWKGEFDEEGSLAIYIYQRFHKQCARCEFHLFEKWIDRFVRNWGHTDGISCWLLAASIANEPALVEELPAWTASPNRWKRRAAAVALVPSARKGLHTTAIFDIARRLIGDADDMAQKGVGWLLKETYPRKRREVLAFLRRHPQTPRLVLRYAAEKMTPKDKRAILRP